MRPPNPLGYEYVGTLHTTYVGKQFLRYKSNPGTSRVVVCSQHTKLGSWCDVNAVINHAAELIGQTNLRRHARLYEPRVASLFYCFFILRWEQKWNFTRLRNSRPDPNMFPGNEQQLLLVSSIPVAVIRLSKCTGRKSVLGFPRLRRTELKKVLHLKL